MKIQWFKIQNFRSILDSGRCEVGHDITVLAGKNESGKSNVLLALKAFYDRKFSTDDLPESRSGEPRVTVGFSFSGVDIIAAVRTAFELSDTYKIENKLNKPNYEVTITRSLQEGTFKSVVGGNAITLLSQIQNEERSYWLHQGRKTINAIRGITALPFSIDMPKPGDEEGILKCAELVQTTIGTIEDGSIPQALESAIKEHAGKLQQQLESVKRFSQSKNFAQIVANQIPKLVYFNTFDDMLPSHADQADVEETRIIQHFFHLVNIDAKEIFDEDSKQRRKHVVNRASATISGDFSLFYQQASVRLELEVDGDEILFHIYDGEDGIPFRPEQRSKGFQWFLSFYLTLRAEAEDQNSIILIDEPGLYLHPRAQQDMLSVLESLADDNQIILTSHSPYLINPEKLARVRLVLRDSTDTTVIQNKIHATADKDTLTPIVNAIGFDLSDGIGLSNFLNIVVEGISDYYYLLSMLNYIGNKTDRSFRIIPAVGASQVPNIASILYGWGVPCICVLDNDNEGRGIQSRLNTSLNFEVDKEIVMIPGKKGDCIEDLFTKADFQKYVLPQSETIPIDRNSQAAHGRKAPLAKAFYDRVLSGQTVELSKQTVDRFSQLLLNLGLVELTLVEAK